MLALQPGTEFSLACFYFIFWQFPPFIKDQRELQPTALSATLLAQVTEIYVVDQKPQQC